MNISLAHIEKSDYLKKYKNKFFLIKISGKEINAPEFQKTVQDLKKLIENGIFVFLVFGGGDQIDLCWQQKNTSQRPQKDEVNITTKKVLEEAVCPAFAKITKKLEKDFCGLDYNLITPENIESEFTVEYTGVPTSIHNLKFHKKLNIIGFLGKNQSAYTNINADDLVFFIIKNYPQKFFKIIFLTKTKGILDKKGELIDFLAKKQIAQILASQDPNILVEGGMKKKVQVIYNLLSFVPNIALTHNGEILKEITHFEGAGTMICDITKGEFQSLKYKDIFQVVYEQNRSKNGGNWKDRSNLELVELFKNHWVYVINESVLGGFSLTEKKIFTKNRQEEKVYLLECLWVAKKGVGIGKIIMSFVQKKFKKLPVFAYSKNNVFFGFNVIQEAPLSSSGAKLWKID